MKTLRWTPTIAWLVAVTAAFVFALAGPSETNVMGRLPNVTAKRLDQQFMVLPGQIPADRSLALVAYSRTQRAEIDSWIRGLGLDRDNSGPWFRMPVLNDPGSEGERNAIEHRLLERHPTDAARARLVPVFTNREAFIRAAGLSGSEHASVLVVDREGKVLARAEGPFDEDKARALRQTLLSSN